MALNATNFSSTIAAPVYVECALSNIITWKPPFSDVATQVSSISSIVVNLLTMPFTVLLNALVIKVVMSEPSLREQNSNIALAQLAITDFFSGAISQPLFIAREITHLTKTGPFCVLENAVHFCVYVFSGVSLYQLTLVTLDRFVAVTKPYHYKSLINATRLVSTGAAFWFFNALFAIVRYSFPQNETVVFACNIVSTLKTCILTAFIDYCYVKIFMEAKKQAANIKMNMVSHKEVEKSKKEHRAAKTVLILVGMVFIAYTPIFVLFICATFKLHAILDNAFAFSFVPWTETFLFLNSFCNPIIYCLRNSVLRRAVLKKLGWKNTVWTQAEHGKPPVRDNTLGAMGSKETPPTERNIDEESAGAVGPASTSKTQSKSEGDMKNLGWTNEVVLVAENETPPEPGGNGLDYRF